ncbi:MAG: hypothetical protein CMH63_00195 [Nanoarchaeota archaeon]|jgi:hypothetical protein|nr:hypothetical protein [Nanoarchaeota archaeon]|tara:strand:+ start:38197 stop:38640 length:444 start_codon:yes stop_codon:yes gene_type:complete
MPIVSFNLDKTLAERTGKLTKGMQARHNITVTSVDKEDIRLGEKNTKPGLKFGFEYIVEYLPKVGKVIVAGTILFLDNEKKIKQTLDDWKKNKKLSPELAAQVLNTAIVKSTIKALHLSQEINLPPHMPIPTVTPTPQQGKEQDYIG